ncbi:MAG: HypC/HybG/HupF family hydrogenase formation chaperone [Candidatus Hydrothermae bacterium]|nr:HypC/HybG/HupF family hydrogenase formation chaperone [Candidatus Hydrothermae bacterium]
MCLGIPMKLVELNWPDGKAELGGVKRDVRLDLLEDVKVGDYIIVHAGYAIQRLDEEEALETLRILKEARII